MSVLERNLARVALHNQFVARLGKSSRPSAPPTAEYWNRGYAARYTAKFAALDEMAHHAVLAGYLARLSPGGSVLDVGCGAGVTAGMIRHLRRAYLGVDLSDVAIEEARRNAAADEEYRVADAAAFEAPGRYDAILFSECIEYFPDLPAVMRRYRAALNENGVILVSMWLRWRSAHRWAWIEQGGLDCIDQTIVENAAGGAWVIRAFHARG